MSAYNSEWDTTVNKTEYFYFSNLRYFFFGAGAENMHLMITEKIRNFFPLLLLFYQTFLS